MLASGKLALLVLADAHSLLLQAAQGADDTSALPWQPVQVSTSNPALCMRTRTGYVHC